MGSSHDFEILQDIDKHLDRFSCAVEAGLELSVILLPQPLYRWHCTSNTRPNLAVKSSFLFLVNISKSSGPNKTDFNSRKETNSLRNVFTDTVDCVAGGLFPPFFPIEELQKFPRPPGH